MMDLLKAIGSFANAIILLFFLLTVGIPYLVIYGNARDSLLRAVIPNKVWLIEDNPLITMGYIEPHMDIVQERDEFGMRYYYAKFNSLSKAEEWLKNEGYRKAQLSTKKFTTGIAKKNFPVKKIPGTEIFSIINIAVDYGDGDIHFLSYRYAVGDSPFDSNSLEKLDKRDESQAHLMPWGHWYSTDHYGSHTWGGHHIPNALEEGDQRMFENLTWKFGGK